MSSDDGYERLRAAILAGDFQPNERLIEADLIESLGVSRAAVRTALVRLAHEGLVEHERNRGAKVRLVQVEEAIEIMQARALLEALAAREAAVRASDAEVHELRQILAELRRLLDAGDLVGCSTAGATLHARILEIARHATAARLVSSLNSQMVRFQYRTILVPGRAARSLSEHTAVVEAIAARAPAAAEAAMRLHLDHVTEALRSSVASQPRAVAS